MNFNDSFKMARETFVSLGEYEFLCLWEGRKVSKKIHPVFFAIPVAIALVAAVIFVLNSLKPEIKGQVYRGNTGGFFEYPVQRSTSEKTFRRNFNGTEVEIVPKADYSLGFLVMSVARYGGISGDIAPIDVAGVWGGLLDGELLSEISITQYNRFYFFRYTDEFPFGTDYIYAHSANMHLIPSSENIRNVFEHLDKNSEIVIEGYLVNLSWKTESGDYHWNTSLSRNDSGAGACEIIYVKKLLMDGYVYE